MFEGNRALALFNEKRPDRLVLDINMPGMNGLSVAREVRRSSSVPVIFLSGRTDEIDRVLGLELGGDDYVAKPFSPREVVYNLVGNAINYTPEDGTVRISFPPEGGAGESAIRIDDSGPGVPPEERERVFERFYRIDKSRASDRGGRGLGLAISGEIVKAHGGTIEVPDSDLGGAAFTVRIPFSKKGR